MAFTHWVLDKLVVVQDLLAVDWIQERPRRGVRLHVSQELLHIGMLGAECGSLDSRGVHVWRPPTFSYAFVSRRNHRFRKSTNSILERPAGSPA
jgi:hypothetical protein